MRQHPGGQRQRACGVAFSIASPALRRHPRYVDSDGWTNYDTATPTGDCREMLAKGKKLTLPH